MSEQIVKPENVINGVFDELTRAIEKFPTWPTDPPLHALAVLGEEFGELTKDVLQMTYEPHKTSAENVRNEAIQTAAKAEQREKDEIICKQLHVRMEYEIGMAAECAEAILNQDTITFTIAAEHNK
jgi:hypothetical protein